MPNSTELELLIDDPRLAEHFESGELIAEPAEIEVDIKTLAIEVDSQELAISGLKESVGRFLTSKKAASVVVLSALGAGFLAGSRRTAHS